MYTYPKTLVGVLIACTLLLPALSAALTNEELNAQISSILAQVAQLQAKIALNTAVSTSTTAASVPAAPVAANIVCPVFNFTLAPGARGAAVVALQNFFVTQGFLTADSVTGFYGNLTQSAVQNFQAQRGIVASGSAATTGWGRVGKLTSAAIVQACSAPQPANPSVTTIGPIACMVANPPTSSCSTGWKPIKDPAGCTVAYDCATPLPVATSTQNRCPLYSLPVCTTGSTLQSSGIDYSGCPLPLKCAAPGNTNPYISVNLPASAPQGSPVTITWNSWNAPANSAVVLSTASSGRIAQGLNTSGTYSWTIPGSNCDNGNPPQCFVVLDNPNVWATTAGHTLQISAQLYTPADAVLGGGLLAPSTDLVYVAKSSPVPILITVGQ